MNRQGPVVELLDVIAAQNVSPAPRGSRRDNPGRRDLLDGGVKLAETSRRARVAFRAIQRDVVRPSITISAGGDGDQTCATLDWVDTMGRRYRLWSLMQVSC